MYLQPDPIGQMGGLNVYSYALSSPSMFTDPSGLKVSLHCERIPRTKNIFTHCYVNVTCAENCEGPPLNVTLELSRTTDEVAAGHENGRIKKTGNSQVRNSAADGRSITPDGSSDCSLERCVLQAFERRRRAGETRYSRVGNNSNTFASGILSDCGISADWSWREVGNDTTWSPW